MEGGFLLPESMDNDVLYAIGVLSKMMDVSTDTLRYYDEIGLLKPAKTSQETGYRYYTSNQIATLLQIIELKQYGFSLNEIKRILNQGEVTPTDMYLTRYWALENEKRKLQEAIDELAEKIIQRQEDIIMNKKILIVDDAQLMRLLCKDLLTLNGYDVVGEACDGLEAVDLYKSLKPDIVLLDIVMPNCDGINALKRIKEYDKNAHVVMISAMSQARIIAEAFLAGARGFISKPFPADDLLRKLKDSLLQVTAINNEIAQKIHSAFVDDTYVFAPHEVEMIVNIILSQAETNEVESTINRLKNSQRFR